jgi:hypothetical protein
MNIRDAANAMEAVLRNIDRHYYMSLNKDTVERMDAALIAFEHAKHEAHENGTADEGAVLAGMKSLGAHWHLSYDETDSQWDCLRREDGNITAMLSASSALAAVNAAREKELGK